MKKKPAPKETDYLSQSRCGNCRCWKRLDDSEQMPREDVLGECVHFPPHIVGIEDGEAVQVMPIVEARHWCGQHAYRVN